MGGEIACHGAKSGVCHKGDLPDVFVVVPDKTEVGAQGSGGIPTGKRWGLDDEAREITGSGKIWINLPGKLFEIGFFQR